MTQPHRTKRMRQIVGLCCLLALHLAGLWLFQRGFLLRRMETERRSGSEASSSSTGVPLSPRFKKAAIMLIDALRFDFVIPPEDVSTTQRQSRVHLTEVARRVSPVHSQAGAIINEVKDTASNTASASADSIVNSLLFHFIADPPTTTMQRLKALTTGSLPTFIDAGSNFASSAIHEDNWLDQCNARDRDGSVACSLVMMGDDTWAALYPRQFARQHDYPSLNVFDLHTVDNGCLDNVWKYIGGDGARVESNWTVLVSHFLGVDHCGHRLGADHPETDAKLQQMNGFLGALLPRIDDDTVLFVFGDHGMDNKGDHGGDSRLEVDAALFVHSKQPILTNQASRIWSELQVELTRHDMGQAWEAFDPRFPSISQIDWVPTLSLLLGLPIPYGNLGAVIPQMFLYHRAGCPFAEDKEDEVDDRCIAWTLIEALNENTRQIHEYLAYYAQLPSASSDFSPEILAPLERLYVDATEARHSWIHDRSSSTLGTAYEVIVKQYRFAKAALAECRKIWAQFDMKSMVFGGSVLVAVSAALLLWTCLRRRFDWLALVAIVAHAVGFVTNSFIINEVHVVFYLAQTLNLYVCWRFYFAKVDTQQQHRAGNWWAHPITLLVITRIVSTSIICREEQFPQCSSTFYSTPPLHLLTSSFEMTSNTTTTLLSTLPLLVVVVGLPAIVARQLRPGLWTNRLFQLGLTLLAMHWLAEYFENVTMFVPNSVAEVWLHRMIHQERVKVIFARMGIAMGAVLFAGGAVFQRAVHERHHTSMLLGLFLLVTATQTPVGIWMMMLAFWQFLVYHHHKSVSALPLHLITTALSLLSWQHFFATGHQATFSSIQFQTGFIGLYDFDFYLSGALVSLNAIGPALWFAWATNYVAGGNDADAIWSGTVLHRSLTTCISTLFAAHFRRHLMVWKVFAPRFMLAAVDLVVVDVALVAAAVMQGKGAAVDEVVTVKSVRDRRSSSRLSREKKQR